MRLDALIEQYELDLYSGLPPEVLEESYDRVLRYMGHAAQQDLLTREQIRETVSQMISLNGK